MANEIAFSASLSVFKAAQMGSPIGRSIAGLLVTMTGNAFVEGNVTVATSATVIPLGSVTAPGWAAFHNVDPTNYLTIRNGLTGAALAQLLAGEWAFFRLFSTAVPYALANTAACNLEYLIANT